jgi:hypothetical protein
MMWVLLASCVVAEPNDFVVARGQITFDAEGNEGGRWHSRTHRGDYTAKTREWVQPCVVKNDLGALPDVLSDREKWSSGPEDRFNRRAAYAKKAADRGK